MNRDLIDAAALHLRRQKALATHAAAVTERAFWRALNPALTVSDGPVAPAPALDDLDGARRDLLIDKLLEEGYGRTRPVVPPAMMARLREAVANVTATGLPGVFVYVYDEPYALFRRLSDIVEPILGERPLLLPQEFWAFSVPPGDAARTRWTAFEPHRDWLGGDPGVVAGLRPTAVNLWVPLVDVTPIDSCIYVVPADCDPDYRSPRNSRDWSRIRLQDVRALPARAGSVLLWSTHLVHWGSRSSVFSATPRVSITGYLQRRDAPPFAEPVDLDGPIRFEDRLRWIFKAIADAGPTPAVARPHMG